MRKGSITLYLSLILLVMLSLLSAAFYSARSAASRAVIASGMEQGLYSLFSQYDKILYEDYGLMFLDGGYGGSSLSLASLLEETEDYMRYIVNPSKNRLFGGSLLNITIDGGSVKGYSLATDNGSAALKKQIYEVMKLKIGVNGIEAIKNMLLSDQSTSESQETLKEQYSEAQLEEEYEALKEQAKEISGSAEDNTAGDASSYTEENSQAQLPDSFENPIEVYQNLMKMGLYASVISDPENLSTLTVDKSSMPSRRTLQKGMGLETDSTDGVADQFMLLEYLAEFFPCYTDNTDDTGLKYQIEYVITGKENDMDNLKGVLNRLATLREAANFVYILTDPQKQAEAEEAALLISTILTVPEAQQGVAKLVELAWAYVESLNDLKILLGGGKVPLIKDASSWKTELGSLSSSMTAADLPNANSSGLDYKWYLRMLLMMKSETVLTAGLTDLLEYNRKNRGGDNFALDSCISSVELEISGTYEKLGYTIDRSYAYS